MKTKPRTPPGSVPAPPAVGAARRWLPRAAVVLAIGSGVWYWWHPAARPAPPLPADVRDPELRQALEAARQRVQSEPRAAASWGELGLVLLAHQYEAEADGCFAEAARLDPEAAEWPYYRGLYAARYDPDHAVAFLRQAVAGRCPAEYRSALRLRLAEALLERAELDEAEHLFRDEVRERPSDPRAAFGLGMIAAARGDDRRAADLLTVARTGPTVRKPATARLAALARNRGDPEAAARLEREAVALPSGPQAWPDPLIDLAMRRQVGPQKRAQDLARIEEARNPAEAARTFQQELEKNPSTRAYLGAGLNLARTNDFDRALPLLREAVRRDPENHETCYALAEVLLVRGEAELARSPNSPLARTCLREAVETVRRGAERKPDHANSYLLWGRALVQLGEPAAAVEPLRKGVACRPESFPLQLALGEALLECKSFAEAEKHLRNAGQLAPKDPRPEQALERLRKSKG